MVCVEGGDQIRRNEHHYQFDFAGFHRAHGDLLLSTYYTSVWIWFYVLGGFALRGLHLLGLGLWQIGRVFDAVE